jgi:hypothetical protein
MTSSALTELHPKHTEGYSTTEISGVCLPASAPDTLDELRPLMALKSARSTQSLLKDATTSGNGSLKWFDWLSQKLNTMSSFQLAQAFDSPLACYDLALDPDQKDDRSIQSRAVNCVRYAIGLPDVQPARPLPLPAAEKDAVNGFLLPHVGVVVRTDLGPLAVTETDTTTQIVWTDGFALTIPKLSRVDNWLDEDGGRHFWHIPETSGFQVLNVAPEVAAVMAHMQLCEREDLPASMSALASGLSFLKNVWPAAYFSCVRQIKGIVLLQQRGYTRSHSPLSLLGVIGLTAGDEISVGDLLVHESSHVRLELMRQFDPLWEDREPDKRHESPWRQDARPLWGLILGVHAFLNVAHYYQRVSKWLGGDEHAEMLFERQKAKVTDAWERAKAFVQPTSLGEHFFIELEKEVLSL